MFTLFTTPSQVAEGPLRNILTEAVGLVYMRMSAVMDQPQLFDHLQLSLGGANTSFVWTGAGFSTAKLTVFRYSEHLTETTVAVSTSACCSN